MTELVVAFRYFANAPKNDKEEITLTVNEGSVLQIALL
jgi:hypothetical protein